MTGWRYAVEATAAKKHRCDICPDMIARGETYMSRVKLHDDGSATAYHAHPECWSKRMRLRKEAERVREFQRTDPDAYARCMNAEPHPDSAAAKHAARRARNKRRRGKPNVRTFKCRICGFWHLGRQ